ncbi:MAG: hypothetical protein A2987_01920 [Omnitrophica bacterium RIFCSPLOWO2_01_FULL_45_10]|nr:MAG: hypothetical protein A2987_01920 [Omnitrophica bacterium RIFCSPLOWO2_01_FULL_45_10]
MLVLVLLIFLLFITFLTAASEISIIAVNRLKMRRLASGGSRTAKMVLKILETPEKFFSTILVTNNIVNTLIASIVTIIAVSLMGESRGIVVATIAVSIVIIICEVVAKTFAATHSEKLSLNFAVPVNTLIIVFSPVMKVLTKVVNGIMRLVGTKPAAKPGLVTDEEIRALIEIGKEEGVLHKEKYRMLSRILEFSETVVKNVMTPKKEIVSIDINANFVDMLDKVLESGFSRLPVYKDNPDNIIGIINMKDLLGLTCNRDLIVLQDIVYPVAFVSDAKKVTELLKEFQKGHAHLAIVTDTKGNIEGLVTLEDLLEEIVGEIEDEFDVRSKQR